MNYKTTQKLLSKREKLQEDLEKNILLSSENFKITDIPLGIFIGFLMVGVCLWIPVLGWAMIPFIIIACPFVGSHIRKDIAKKKIKKIKEELDNISIVLKD